MTSPTVPPQPAHFIQSGTLVRGPAYGLAFKLFSSLITLGLLLWSGLLALRHPELHVSVQIQIVMLAASLLLIVFWLGFLRATVTLDEAGMTQTGVLRRHIDWVQVRSVKMIGISGLDWLVPPRLLVRTGSGLHAFNAGNAELRDQFIRIARAWEQGGGDSMNPERGL